MNQINRIGILSAGGDAPGMNAAIRAIVRTAIYYKKEAFAIEYGYQGMAEGWVTPLDTTSVSNIIQRGGTILKTSRYPDFEKPEVRKLAYRMMKKKGIDAIIVIGGEGTMKAAKAIQDESDIAVVGVPCTIDNDVTGTDYTVGFDTAVNTAVDAIDRIRDTAESHDRLFFIEVMGRTVGFIGIEAGLAGGAEGILIPEDHGEYEWLRERLQEGWGRRKHSTIVVVAEGDEEGNAQRIAEKVKEEFPHLEYRISVLGHIQRGGKPTARDRVLATRTGSAAVEALLEGKSGIIVGVMSKEIAYTSLEESFSMEKKVDSKWNRLNRILTT